MSLTPGTDVIMTKIFFWQKDGKKGDFLLKLLLFF
jgi:hypothetical protein